MKNVTLGMTGITVPQNAFGALPMQRISTEEAVALVRKAYEGGMRYFDTARGYSDSEEKMGIAIENFRENIFLATKTRALTPDAFWKDLETSLTNLKTDYLDIYQFHQSDTCFKPDDGTGMYECMVEAKKQGKIKHIGITTHKIGVAMEAAESGLYEMLMFPFSYLSGDKEFELLDLCRKNNVGFVSMKALAGGLINRYDAAMAFINEFDDVLPLWGIQKQEELDQWLSCFDETPVMNEEIKAYIEKEKEELSGEFCRGCGYCEPCTVGIMTHQCARMSLMLRRAPSEAWLTPYWQTEMKKIENCINCGKCASRCPYELNTPELLRKNYEDYKNVLAGKTKVN